MRHAFPLSLISLLLLGGPLALPAAAQDPAEQSGPEEEVPAPKGTKKEGKGAKKKDKDKEGAKKPAPVAPPANPAAAPPVQTQPAQPPTQEEPPAETDLPAQEDPQEEMLEPEEPEEPGEPGEPGAQEEPEEEELPVDTSTSVEGIEAEEESSIEGLRDLQGMGSQEDFVPLDPVNEESLIFPATLYPFIDWHGHFRVRQIMASGFDLGTRGTSSILPPVESYTPNGVPADPDASRLWSTDFRLRIQPRIIILEGLSIQVEADLLANQVFGALPIQALPQSKLRPDPSRNQAASGQISQREREWFSDAVQINEVYGEYKSFLGTIRAGRMDNDWGLGMFYNGGDCLDCNFGDHIDRLEFESAFQGIYGAFSFDFPAEGLTNNTPLSTQQQPLDSAQIDDVDQYTLSFEFTPKTQTERAVQQKLLTEDRKVILNGGALFSFRTQDGTFTDLFTNPENTARGGNLIYRGLDMYMLNGWGRLLWEPSAHKRMRIELEAMGIFGSLDNRTLEPVGTNSAEDSGRGDFNCFDEDVRDQGNTGCTTNSKEFGQFAVTLETEFSLNKPIAFGLNAGLASGGDSPNWAWTTDQSVQTQGRDLDFFRFDPDYHVDLILFRQVIGTVTNAYYFNPYIQASFLEGDGQKLRFDADVIVSRAFDQEGTPAGDNAWLGAELDAAIRFIQNETFQAAFEAGLLFPLAGLNAVTGRQRLTQFGSLGPTFTEDVDTSTAWTLQFKLDWSF